MTSLVLNNRALVFMEENKEDNSSTGCQFNKITYTDLNYMY